MTTSATPDPVVSGVPYEVLEVEGRTPRSVDDFVGSRRFVLKGRTGRHVVSGDGGPAGEESVRFHEKGADSGKDMRVWHIHRSSEGTFIAESV